MNLILQAIKSLFRKTEGLIKISYEKLSKEVASVQKRATTALNRAVDAWYYADEAWNQASGAWSRAEEALSEAKKHQVPILTVTSVYGSVGTTTGISISRLQDGGLYGVVSNANVPDTTVGAYLKIGTSSYPIYVRSGDYKTVQTLDHISSLEKANRIFRKGMVSLVQYSATKAAFISLNSYSLDFIRTLDIVSGSVTENGYRPGGFVMMLENQVSRAPSKMVYSVYPRIPSTNTRSNRWFNIVVNDDGVLGTVDGNLKTVRSIPSPDTAEVGQTIRVSAVNANGVPTAWEAVDMPSGGGSGIPFIKIETVYDPSAALSQSESEKLTAAKGGPAIISLALNDGTKMSDVFSYAEIPDGGMTSFMSIIGGEVFALVDQNGWYWMNLT